MSNTVQSLICSSAELTSLFAFLVNSRQLQQACINFSGVARICCEEGQSWKVWALAVDLGPNAAVAR